MSNFSLSYREVIPYQSLLDPSEEITLNTGGTQSTLQDIKVAERSNGYCYEDCTKHHTRNRFIYWKINYDVLELVEHSLDINLSGNRIRYKFLDTPILDGISIHETYEHVVILVPTVCSVHRFIFPHPDTFYQSDGFLGSHPDLAAPSIFARASTPEAREMNSCHMFNNSNISSDQLPTLASSYLTNENVAFFALAYSTGELLLIKQLPNGQALTSELKGETLMPRFLHGLAEKLRAKPNDSDNVISLLILNLVEEPFVLTLARDGQLKFWSTSRSQCLAVINIVAESGQVSREHIQTAILRKSVNDEQFGSGTLVVFMSFATGCQFHILRPVLINGQQIRLNRLGMLHSPEKDLIDFALETNRLWSAWRCENGDCAIYSANLVGSNHWTPIVLETLPHSNIAFNVEESHKDPRQVYLEYIFYPGRFPLHIISKALCIYKRLPVLAHGPLSPTLLKQRICMAVDNEIETTLKQNVVSDEEYLDCAHWCWQNFYSCVVQYHVAGLKPIGLLLLPSVSGAVFLKKTSFSFLRPLDPLEHLTYCSDFMYKDQFNEFPAYEDVENAGDVLTLFEVIAYLDQQINEFFNVEFEKELYALKSPDVVMEELLEKIQNELDNQFTVRVVHMLDQCEDFYKAIHKILEILRHDHIINRKQEDVTNSSALHYFSSHLGVSFVAGCLRQQALTRFTICRNLLLICKILLKNRDLEWDLLEVIRSVCCPELVMLTQANYVMYWISGLPAVVNMPHDLTLQRLAPVKLNPVFNIRSNNPNPVSLLELFTASVGGHEARKAFAKAQFDNRRLPHWHSSLLSYLDHLTQFIYPVGNSTVLIEWLLSSGQHLCLQQYVRLLSHWCEWNNCTRNFLLAASYLTSGENYKAQELFLTAARGIATDKFLQQRIPSSIDDNPSTAYVNYYLKVIQLFELHKARDCAINLANIALSIVDNKDPLAATLYSIKFKHHLALKHYSKAFDSLNSNPDTERKKDNLRDLVKTLLDEKQLDILLNFTYGSLDELFSNILLSRARATDAVDNVFYDFLYAYQIKRGPLCHRLAASVMYEQAFRLSTINNSPEALEKQVKCFLAAKNALQLCDKKYAWVVRPSDPDEVPEEVTLQARAGSGEEAMVLKLQKQVEVLGVEVIKKDLIFASAKLKLVKFMVSESSVNVTNPVELVTLLNNVGLFKTALQICSTFNLPYNSVFEHLTKHCILLTEEELPNVWDWLVENDLQDLTMNRECVADIVWQLLQDYLEKYEEPNMTVLHQVVVRKIIAMNIFIPYWLLASYKKRNASELLKLLHLSGRLEEAVSLVHELILAAMGYGKEFYGFEMALAPTSKAFCLPVYAIKNLIAELNVQNQKNVNKPYAEQHKVLSSLFYKYLETSTRISNEMCRLKY